MKYDKSWTTRAAMRDLDARLEKLEAKKQAKKPAKKKERKS